MFRPDVTNGTDSGEKSHHFRTTLAFLHLGVGDEHLSEVFEQTRPAEGAVGNGGAGHLRDGGNTEQFVLRVTTKSAHQLS